MSFKASAPGSLMLLGEYAVLHGKHALVYAVNKRMTVTLIPRLDSEIEIISELGYLKTHLSQLTIVPPFQFVLTAIQSFKKKLKQGFTLKIESEFTDKIGLGSSAAVTVATLAVLHESVSINLKQDELLRKARTVIQAVQGIGSGADVAASVMGGVISYKMQPLMLEKLDWDYPLTVIYSGYKTPTPTVIAQVKQLFFTHPIILNRIFQTMDACVLKAINYIKDQNWSELGKIMNIQQGLLDSLGVNAPLLGDIINLLRNKIGILGAKISGSGQGDCIIGLGAVPQHEGEIEFADPRIKPIFVDVAQQGVICEKI